LTPFIYFTSFTRGLSPASLVWDIPANIPPDLAGHYDENIEFHGPVSIRTALTNDYLAPALQTLTQVGPANVWSTAQQSGLQSMRLPEDADPYRMLLDKGQVSLLETAHAYSMLGNQGVLAGQGDSQTNGGIFPPALLKVSDPSGRVWLDWSTTKIKPIANAQLAYLVTNILADDLSRRQTLGRPNPLETGRPAAVMLGQTAGSQQTWAVGYSPQLLVGVWMGYPGAADPLENAPKIDRSAAASLWNGIFRKAHSGLPIERFNEPVGLSHMDVCDPSGLLPTADCPQVSREIFMPGSEPLQADNLYKKFLVNRQTNLLATVYTPPEYVEEQVYLVVPPEAAEWAKAAGIKIPPDRYDAIFNPSGIDPNVNISTPEIFGYVSGKVEIRGSAQGEDFALFRVRIGEGLNPRQWLQIGEDSTSPVSEGILGVWDTGGLNGLYAVQLVVIRQNQKIETAILQVTVDNEPPEILISYPLEGQSLAMSENTQITIQVQAGDNLAVTRIEIYIDDMLISSLTTPPYFAPWNGLQGEHRLRVVAYDLGGNESSSELTFSIDGQ
ncbi:MAG: Ig-like domain-containing protein, partial [Anaerolineae bacterium]|nr:Ig-like domain-containing protein [Anaerolineae bacterium]